MIKIELEDKGQDFLEWDISEYDGKIIACRPFQGWLWNGKKLKLGSLKLKSRPVFQEGSRLNYKIIQITQKKFKLIEKKNII